MVTRFPHQEPPIDPPKEDDTDQLKEWLVELSIKVIVLAEDEEGAAEIAGDNAQNGAYQETFEWDPTIKVIEEVPEDA